eukprot:GGOE01046030.1.p1 GENE.GGOE01046030.1~~GGOE01046030.1.p1  ORF type:complete len:521 (-),score=94.11 GGOE01046030.1:211-1773(-)
MAYLHHFRHAICRNNASRNFANVANTMKMLIDGHLCEASDGATVVVHCPHNGASLASIPNAAKLDIDRAVQAATVCFNDGSWRWVPPERKQYLRKLGDLLYAQLEEFAALESNDCGKPLAQSREDMETCVGLLRYYADLLPEAIQPTPLPVPDPAFSSEIQKAPIGVVGCITPWNYPLLQAVCKVAPALAAGCTVVLKPSPWASLTCLRFGELALEASLPPGALNIVSGGPPHGTAGQMLTTHPGLAKLSFTGSSRAGRDILHASADHLRPTALELGGKGAMLVFDDADVPSAVDWCMTGIFSCAGQVCSANSRLLLQRPIADRFLAALVQATAALRVGHPLDPTTNLGPLVSAEQRDRVLLKIEAAKAAGCTVIQPATMPIRSELHGGYFVPPTILLDVPPTCEAWTEEIFGPVLSVRLFDTEAEAIAIANATVYGLADAVMSCDLNRCNRVAERLQSGTVWQNCSQALFNTTPFGGAKQSGFGREWGLAGLEEYQMHRTVIRAQFAHSVHAFTPSVID